MSGVKQAKGEPAVGSELREVRRAGLSEDVLRQMKDGVRHPRAELPGRWGRREHLLPEECKCKCPQASEDTQAHS